MPGISILVTSVLLSWTFALYRMLHAKQIAELRTKYHFEELKRKYERMHSLGSLAMIFLVIPAALAGGFFFGRLACVVAEQWYWRTPETKFLVSPSWIVIYFTLGFLSFIAIPTILIGFGKLVLGLEKYREYEAYDSLKAGFDTSRIVPVMVLAIAIPMLLLLVMSVDNFIRCETDNIVVNPFWTLGSTGYAMGDVARIEVRYEQRSVGNGVSSIPFYRLYFKDGHSWSTQGPLTTEVNSTALSNQRDLLEFLSERSGVPIQEIEH